MRDRSILMVLFGVLIWCGVSTLPIMAQDAPIFESQAAQAILVDAKSGIIFYEKDANTPIPPASMSKLVTQAIVFDALKFCQFNSF